MGFPLIGAVLGGLQTGANMYTGAQNLKGVRETNKMNQAIAREQMKFQERMSSTAHQRQTADLVAAGLNPILSGTGGSGASAPSGASATMQAPDYSFVADGINKSMSSAMDYATTVGNMQAQGAQTAKTVAETINALETNKAIQANVTGQTIANARDAGVMPHTLAKARTEAGLSANALALNRATMSSQVLAAREGVSAARLGNTKSRAELPAVAETSRVKAENAEVDKRIDQFSEVLGGIGGMLNIGNWFRGRPGTRGKPPSPASPPPNSAKQQSKLNAANAAQELLNATKK